MFRFALTALIFLVLSGCISDQPVSLTGHSMETQVKEKMYFHSVATSRDIEDALNCNLKELNLAVSNKTLDYKRTEAGWEIDIIPPGISFTGKSWGPVGKVIFSEGDVHFVYYKRVGNFGLDAMGVEKNVPRAMNRCV